MSSTDEKVESAMESTRWKKMTVVQLKSNLARLELSTEGNKAELVERLVQYDLEKKEEEPPEEEQMEELEPVEEEIIIPSFLTTQKVREGYEATNALRTVIIYPFNYHLIQDTTLVTWMEKSKSFDIKKETSGEVAAELVFATISMGEQAHLDIQESLQDCEVTHPRVALSEESYDDAWAGTELDRLLKTNPWSRLQWSKLLPRLVVLEGLTPSMNTEESLLEFFPEATNRISFEFDKTLAGIAILEFPTHEEAHEYANAVGSEAIQIEDAEVKITKLLIYLKEIEPKEKREKLKKSQDLQNEIKAKTLTDEEHLALFKEKQELIELAPSLQLVEVDNIKKVHQNIKNYHETVQRIEDMKLRIKFDKQRRIKSNLPKISPEEEKKEEAEDNDKQDVVVKIEEYSAIQDEMKRDLTHLSTQIIKYKQQLRPAKTEKAVSGVVDEKNQIFVGGLNHTTTNTSLKAYFEQWGPVVHCNVPIDPMKKRARGFGFVGFKDQKDVQTVIENIPHTVDNKVVDVKLSQRESMNNLKNQAGSKTATNDRPWKNLQDKDDNMDYVIFVGNLPHLSWGAADVEELKKLFRAFGPVTNVHVVKGKSKPYAILTMDSQKKGKRAVQQLNGFMFHGRSLNISKKGEVANPMGGGGGFKRKIEDDPLEAKRSMNLIQGLSNALSNRMEKLETMQLLHQNQIMSASLTGMGSNMGVPPPGGMGPPATSPPWLSGGPSNSMTMPTGPPPPLPNQGYGSSSTTGSGGHSSSSYDNGGYGDDYSNSYSGYNQY